MLPPRAQTQGGILDSRQGSRVTFSSSTSPAGKARVQALGLSDGFTFASPRWTLTSRAVAGGAVGMVPRINKACS